MVRYPGGRRANGDEILQNPAPASCLAYPRTKLQLRSSSPNDRRVKGTGQEETAYSSNSFTSGCGATGCTDRGCLNTGGDFPSDLPHPNYSTPLSAQISMTPFPLLGSI